jgi:hypothetical protein
VRPYLEKNPSLKRVGGVAQGVGPEVKPHSRKKKKKKKGNNENYKFQTLVKQITHT